jgi:hypothetical protein
VPVPDRIDQSMRPTIEDLAQVRLRPEVVAAHEQFAAAVTQPPRTKRGFLAADLYAAAQAENARNPPMPR